MAERATGRAARSERGRGLRVEWLVWDTKVLRPGGGDGFESGVDAEAERDGGGGSDRLGAHVSSAASARREALLEGKHPDLTG
jgi:hypothetical protein